MMGDSSDSGHQNQHQNHFQLLSSIEESMLDQRGLCPFNSLRFQQHLGSTMRTGVNERFQNEKTAGCVSPLSAINKADAPS